MPGVIVRDNEPFDRALKDFQKHAKERVSFRISENINTLKNRVNAANVK